MGGSGLVLLRPVGSTIRTHSPDGPDSQLDLVDLVDPETSGNDNPRVDCCEVGKVSIVRYCEYYR